MVKRVIIHKNRYTDSVSLMRVSEQLMKVPGVAAAEVQMATAGNCTELAAAGFEIPTDSGPNDMVIAVSADNADILEQAMQRALELLDGPGGGEVRYHTLKEVREAGLSFDIAQISLPGEYAATEAHTALDMGMNVFIFSDNVTLQEELELKRHGMEKALLVMGPDCGVGFMGGVCLGAGSIMKPGAVGIVAASGSGAQEVACIAERCGEGISSIIGTGGRDLYPEIGGISMLAGIKHLQADPETKVIVLVSKLADNTVMEKILRAADISEKPVIVCFLGAEEGLFAGHTVRGTDSMETAALQAVALLRGGAAPAFGFAPEELQRLADEAVGKLAPRRKYFRGLYCGGTFTEETLVYFNRHHAELKLNTNLNNRYAAKLKDAQKSEGHTILDLGAEEFTALMPHPVFDPEIRLKRLEQELTDSEAAVIMLDFITGPGVHEDPVTPFAEICKRMTAGDDSPIFIATICGSALDPQDVAGKRELLERSGVIVADSNIQSARLAGALMAALTPARKTQVQ